MEMPTRLEGCRCRCCRVMKGAARCREQFRQRAFRFLTQGAGVSKTVCRVDDGSLSHVATGKPNGTDWS